MVVRLTQQTIDPSQAADHAPVCRVSRREADSLCRMTKFKSGITDRCRRKKTVQQVFALQHSSLSWGGAAGTHETLKLLGIACYICLLPQNKKPPLAKEKSSRLAKFFQSETLVPGMAAGPAAGLGNAASGTPAAGSAPHQSPFPA